MKVFNVFCILIVVYYVNCASFGRSKSKRSLFIASGTLWCGAGNIATSCNDLGEFNETDSCCRKHDACPYTFNYNQPAYNGFFSDKIYTISHCECDLMFHDCLNEQPYKPYSFVIWESFKSLEVNCFGYFPCEKSADKKYDNIWSNLEQRQTGKCINGSRLILFHSIMDYSGFIQQHLTHDNLNEIKQLLDDNQYTYTSERKRNFRCNYLFPNFTQEMADNFGKNFLPDRYKQTPSNSNSSDDNEYDEYMDEQTPKKTPISMSSTVDLQDRLSEKAKRKMAVFSLTTVLVVGGLVSAYVVLRTIFN